MNKLLTTIVLLPPLQGNGAYLDPGSGSFILQIILAALLGGLVIIRTYWNKIKDGVGRLFSRQGKVEEDEQV
jgi:hypothetical protein